MDYFAQQLINGLVLGSIYGLIAIGYTMVYGIVGMINFAHGDIFMIGGFIALISFLLLVSMGIGVMTAGLVYIALHFLFVRPMRRLTASMVGFHEDPESSARIIVPSQRGDEIGVAERELSAMQRDLVSMLHQKSRLAALGLAVSKINHDLRNLLASS